MVVLILNFWNKSNKINNTTNILLIFNQKDNFKTHFYNFITITNKCKFIMIKCDKN